MCGKSVKKGKLTRPTTTTTANRRQKERKNKVNYFSARMPSSMWLNECFFMCSHKCLSLFCTYDSAADDIGAPTLCVVSYKKKCAQRTIDTLKQWQPFKKKNHEKEIKKQKKNVSSHARTKTDVTCYNESMRGKKETVKTSYFIFRITIQNLPWSNNVWHTKVPIIVWLW